MAGSKTHMIQNAREEVISSDLTRIGQLAAREPQNANMAKSVRADFFSPAPTTPVIDDFGSSSRGAASAPIAAALSPPSLDPIAGSFNMQLGPGEVEVLDNTITSGDVSPWSVARWVGQTITWPSLANPDATNTKIATIIALPADEQDDQQSRNILLNPMTRSMQPQNVYKTSNPAATIAVIAGSATTPAFPATMPAGAVALFDLLMPPGATQSSQFLITRRCWRNIEFPGTSQHGIVKNCVPTWDYANEATGAPAKLITGGSVVHRLVIDGELLTFNAFGYLQAVADTAHAPGTAPAENDLPTYLYLCGGRNWPCCLAVFGGAAASPVWLVESTTPPDCMGYPSAVLGYGGQTIGQAAALFIGNGFRVAGSTRSKSLFYDGDFVRPQASTVPVCGFHVAAGDHFTTGSTTYVSLAMAGIPVNTTVLELQAMIAAGGAGSATTYPEVLDVLNGIGGQHVIYATLSQANGTGAVASIQSAPVRMARPGSDTIQYQAFTDTSPSTATIDIRPTGYNMNIPRLGS
jgi:hypothetical protein